MALREDRSELPPLTLVLGGARSGKSRHAESLVLASGLEPVYIATAQTLDDEMTHRIAEHRRRRGGAFRTVEAPLELAPTLRAECGPSRAVLVDCLTLWLTNLMVAGRAIDTERERLLAAIASISGSIVLVSNEVGLGVVPAEPMARAFVDEAGRLHQDIAAIATSVVFMAAGLPMTLKGPLPDMPSS